MEPVVYADVLFLYNFLINSIILSVSSKLTGTKVKVFKIGTGACLGGIYSVFMFFPALKLFYTVFFKFITLLGISYLVLGGNSVWQAIKNFAVFLGVNFALSGGVFALIFLTDFGVKLGTVVSDGEVYINLSPIAVFLAVILVYIILILKEKTKMRADYEKELIKRVEIYYKGRKSEFNIFLDTGCQIHDPVNDKGAVLAEYKYVKSLLCGAEMEKIESFSDPYEAYMNGMRVLVLSTVSGKSSVPAILAEKVIIDGSVIKNVTVGILKNKISEKYGGILNPEILFDNCYKEEKAI